MSVVGALWIWIFTGLAAAGVVYTIMAVLVIGRFFPAKPGPRAESPGVTLLKPLYLDEAGLEHSLRSFFDQDYAGPIQIVFGVHGRSDPGLKVAEALRREFPDRDVEIIIDASFEGLNPKIANLINMQRHARHDIVIASDSDISVPRNYVSTMVNELSGIDVGVVTCLYRGRPSGNLWSILEAMHIDYAFLPNVVMGTTLGLARPCFGSTIALTRAVLDEIGGFEAISRHLADDYEIGRAVRAKGYGVKISSLVVNHACTERGFSGLVQHELRWAKTVRVVTGAGHMGSVITHVLPLALIAAAVQGFSAPALVVLAAALGARLWLAVRVRGIITSDAGPIWLLPVRDMLSFAIFLASFFGNTVYWRGTRYLTSDDGVLAQQ